MYSDPTELDLQVTRHPRDGDEAAAAFLADITPDPVDANPALLKLASARRVLLLQGPVGPFFDRLTAWLLARGARVSRVALHAGDLADSQRIEPILFQQPIALWPAFFEKLLAEQAPDCIVLFGQSRAHHQIARTLARRQGVDVIVTEEGYIRPGHLTMEFDGVNALSSTLGRFRWTGDSEGSSNLSLPAAPREKWLWQKMALHACHHYLSLARGRRQFAQYTHHRDTSIVRYSAYWIASLAIKYLRCLPDRIAAGRLVHEPYFFVPLQLKGDSQITRHSRYTCNSEFAADVLRSFVRHAPPNTRIVFKQHPHSRGSRADAALVRAMAQDLAISDRVIHLVEGHTPTLVEHSLGVVVINSTVGLQALARKRPVKVMGDALYGLPGLAYQGSLDSFWVNPGAPQPQMVETFLEQLIHLTQVPCHVYGLRNDPLPWRVPPGPQGCP